MEGWEGWVGLVGWPIADKSRDSTYVKQPGSTCAEGICPNSAASLNVRTSMMTASFLWIRCSTSSEVMFMMLAELGPSVTYTVSLVSATIDLDITMVVCCNAASIINEAMYKQHSDMVSHRHAILCSVWRQPHLLCCWRSNFDFGLYINKPFMTRLQWDRWVIYYSQDSTWLVTSRLATTQCVRCVEHVECVVTSVPGCACSSMADDEEAVVLARTSLVFWCSGPRVGDAPEHVMCHDFSLCQNAWAR